MKKRILMVCEAFGGGVFAYVSQLCNDMCEDFDVYLAYSVRPQTPKNYKDFIDPRVNLIELKELGKLSPKALYLAVKELRKVYKEIKPDVVHLHSSIAGGVGRIAFWKRRNIVYTPHGYAHILMGSGIKSEIYFFLEKILAKGKSITLTCCESEDKEAKKFSSKTAFIETGIKLKEFEDLVETIHPEKKNGFTVFTLGRACVQKQPQLFNEIARRVPNVQFLWVGNGELENVLTAPNIKITGWVPRKEALAMAMGADVFILCSLGEAIAMSLIENMCLKKLCLVSNTIGNKSVIQNGINGYVCNTADEYAKRIRESLERFPHELTDKAYQDILEIYNTEKMKEKYLRFYSGLLV